MSRSSWPLESSCVTLSVDTYVEHDGENNGRLCSRFVCPISTAREKVSVHPAPYSIDRIAHQMGGVSFEVERLKFCLCMSHSRTEVMRPDGSVQSSSHSMTKALWKFLGGISYLTSKYWTASCERVQRNSSMPISVQLWHSLRDHSRSMEPGIGERELFESV